MTDRLNPNRAVALLSLALMFFYSCDTNRKNSEPDPNESVSLYQMPKPVKTVVPKYPKVAMDAKLEATVWVKILVGKDGIPIKVYVEKAHGTKVRVDKFDNETYEFTEIFKEPALKAAMQWRFIPALANPADTVQAWTTVPFKFRLAD